MPGDFNVNFDAQATTDKARAVLSSYRVIKGFSGKTSISALSKDLIMQFPVLISSDIQTDDIITIAKALEQMYATMFIAVWTADAAFGVNDKNMHGVRDFVRRYHNNSDIPNVITYGGDLLDLTDKFFAGEAALQSVRISPESGMAPEEVAQLWVTTESQLSLESINDLYLPEKASREKINRIASAMEGPFTSMGTGDSYDFYDIAQHVSRQSVDPEAGDWRKSPRGVTSETRVAKSVNRAGVVKNDKLTALEPTLIDVNFLMYGPGAGQAIHNTKKGKNGKSIDKTTPVTLCERHAVVGVKTMLRLIPPQLMVPNVISSLQDQSMAFKFVKWTKGEYKLARDLIFNVSQIKSDASPSNVAEAWFAALRKRKRAAQTFRFSETGINPFATLVVTSDEVDAIKETSGYDLMKPDIFKSLMSNLFLLGFMVVNTNSGLVYSVFDGYNDFSTVTLKSLKPSKKEADSTQMLREMRQLMGRL